MSSNRRTTMQWIGWAASCAVIVGLSPRCVDWVWNSPMVEFSRKFDTRLFFPPDEPEDRFQYFRHLDVAREERVRYATCVLCSVTVQGSVGEQVTVLWGDATVERDGGVKEINVNGGRIAVLAG